MLVFPTIDLEWFLKSAAPSTEPRGGKYIKREWTGDRWKYYYTDIPSQAHGIGAVHDLNDPIFSHSVEVLAEGIADSPEKEYKAALEKALNTSGNHAVVSPHGKDGWALNVTRARTGTVTVSLVDENGKKVKDFASRGAYEMWYLGAANSQTFTDHKGNPYLEVIPNVGRVRNGEFEPSTDTARGWWVKFDKTYLKELPKDQKPSKQKWPYVDKEAADKAVHKMLQDKRIASGEGDIKSALDHLAPEDREAIESAMSSSGSMRAVPGSVADKVQSGEIKYRMKSGGKGRELNISETEKLQLISQAAKEYWPVALITATKMAKNAFFVRDDRQNEFGNTGITGWIERFLGNPLPTEDYEKEKDGRPKIVAPDPDSPYYDAIKRALETYDPSYGVGFTGYLTAQKGKLWSRMRHAQDSFISEIKGTQSGYVSNESGTVRLEDITSASEDQQQTSAHLRGTEESITEMERWHRGVEDILDDWEDKAPNENAAMRDQFRNVLTQINELPMDQRREAASKISQLLLDVGADKYAEKSFKATLLKHLIINKSMNILTRNKNVDPEHTYSFREGSDDSDARFFFNDSQGNLIRYTNAPTGHPDRTAYAGDAQIHYSEPSLLNNPEYFNKDGKKLTSCPTCEFTEIEWNNEYNKYDPKNLWAGRWIDKETGNTYYTYIDSDIRSIPKLQIHQQNVIIDARLAEFRKYYTSLFNSTFIKDQITALALAFLDQGRMRAVEIASVRPMDVMFDSNLLVIGNRRFYVDYKTQQAILSLKESRTPFEPLFSIPLQNNDGSIDTSIRRRIGPYYLSKVLDAQGISLLGLQTYHATTTFSREIQRLLVNYQAPWEMALQNALLSVALEWGHDFTTENDPSRILQLIQSVFIDPIVIETLQANANERGLFDAEPTQMLPQSTIPINNISLELTNHNSEEIEFSNWLHSHPIHNHVESQFTQ